MAVSRAIDEAFMNPVHVTEKTVLTFTQYTSVEVPKEPETWEKPFETNPMVTNTTIVTSDLKKEEVKKGHQTKSKG